MIFSQINRTNEKNETNKKRFFDEIVTKLFFDVIKLKVKFLILMF